MLARIPLFCFGACYAIALALQLWHHFRRRPIFRLLSLGFGGVGLLAQTAFLVIQQPTLTRHYGWMLVLAWILGVFYLYGSLHHPRTAWGLFVLPIVLGLIILASFYPSPKAERISFENPEFLRIGHYSFMLLATVGATVGFIASLMYLVQARRLKAKVRPRQGMQLPSLERLELMNRRALTGAFPLLTLGMFFGVVLTFRSASPIRSWTNPRVLSTGLLWLVFAIVLYLRYGQHLRGRRVALLTITAFILLIVTLVLPHVPREGI